MEKLERYSFVVIGEQSLLIRCCEKILSAGHVLKAIVAADSRIRRWAAEHAVPCFEDAGQLPAPAEIAFDFLISVTNLKMLPAELLTRPARLAINFHDGPLPRYAGLNAPVWALINGETNHGVAWHVMTPEVDAGDILVSRVVPIAVDDTAFTLNARCYESALTAFEELLERIGQGHLQFTAQDTTLRTYFGRHLRPAAWAVIDWQRPARELDRLVRALDFGPYPNPVVLPKLLTSSNVVLVRRAREVAADVTAAPGTILEITDASFVVKCASGGLEIMKLSDPRGGEVSVVEWLAANAIGLGTVLPPLSAEAVAASESVVSPMVQAETRWRRRLVRFAPTELPIGAAAPDTTAWRTHACAADVTAETLVAALSVALARVAQVADIAFAYKPLTSNAPNWPSRLAVDLLPIQLSVPDHQSLAVVRESASKLVHDADITKGYLNDLPARDADVRAAARCEDAAVRVVRVEALSEVNAQRLASGATLTLLLASTGRQLGFFVNCSSGDEYVLVGLVDSIVKLIEDVDERGNTLVGAASLLTENQQRVVAQHAVAPGEATLPSAPELCLHQAFEQQAERTPERVACVCRDVSITYRELNEASNRLARQLQTAGVCLGDRVGVSVDRSIEMLVALYAVLKSGAAYVPLDPAYPAARLAHMASDADVRCVLVSAIDDHAAFKALQLRVSPWPDSVGGSPEDNLDLPVTPSDLAYLIYTSGSTGTPKGVMVEHRNVSNFFVGIDHRIDTTPGTWLAVTSISFDISVLELFWTLARGFTIILHLDDGKAPATLASRRPKQRGTEFGLFYWNVASEDRDYSADKYRLLLDSAKFADEHGFNAVWTPERHFASFGGLFPNPAVTSAALATVTKHVALRAGSCVLPLHSPIRVAEEWAVVDNLSNGRVGISIAAGWAPPDFAIRPEGFANAKRVMFEGADVVKRLWRGEKVQFDGPKGPVDVRTLPRPIQPELPLWVTTAGNLDTFVEAGQIGANLLTHLLGQTIDEVGDKIKAYRAAWVEAGHQGTGTVSLMLHAFVGPDEAAVEAHVRKPFKAYLKSAAFLVKAAAWQFPTFKRMSAEQGRTLDDFFSNVSAEDMDALLEFAYQRYYRSSGLFGTVERCVGMVQKVEAADVDEIACLIDFGVEADVVLAHLPYLNELREFVQHQPQQVTADHSLGAELGHGRVTHFQCTPSMARMLLAEPKALSGLRNLRQMMVGGEALAPDLATALSRLLPGRTLNMYGPTETTIWSTIGDVPDGKAPVSIGRPLAHQTVYVLDQQGRQLPPGVMGEIVIGGDGVARGYWERPELTAERFQPDPFRPGTSARMYRTGDSGRYRADGQIECHGRLDHQVKIRGYRVELGEIEALLCLHPAVAEAVVIMREDTPNDHRLVAYLRSTGDSKPDVDELKSSLRSRLPLFMIPAAFVWLATMPLTPNGKLDRRSLPAPRGAAVAAARSAEASTGAEAMVAEIWRRVLGVDACGLNDNFFDLGGHSLLVVQVLTELRLKVSRPIQLTDLFKYTTIHALARFIEAPDSPPADARQAKTRAARRRAILDRGRPTT